MSAELQRILLIRYGALGDILLTTPLIAALRQRLPQCAIDMIVRPHYLPLLATNPAISQVIPLPPDSELHRLRGPLRAAGYDCVIDLQNKLKSRLLSRFCRAPRSIRLQRRNLTEVIRERLRGPLPASTGEAQRYLAVLDQLGLAPEPMPSPRLQFYPSAAAEARATSLLGDRRPIAIIPCASQATKRWPPTRFAELAQHLAAAGHLDMVLLSGPPDQAYLNAHADAFGPQISLLPSSLSIDEAAAVLARCQLAIGLDTGLLHLSAAVGTAVVALFGPTDARRWGPSGVTHRVAQIAIDCAPCRSHGGPRCPLGHHRCMVELSPEMVATHALALLSP